MRNGDLLTARLHEARIFAGRTQNIYNSFTVLTLLLCKIRKKENREAMEKVFADVFGENGNGYDYIFYPLSGHGLLLDPLSENQYDKALYRYCETYFGY